MRFGKMNSRWLYWTSETMRAILGGPGVRKWKIGTANSRGTGLSGEEEGQAPPTAPDVDRSERTGSSVAGKRLREPFWPAPRLRNGGLESRIRQERCFRAQRMASPAASPEVRREQTDG